MSSRSRKVRKYDEEFKRRAVQLYLTGAKSCETLSEELGDPHPDLVRVDKTAPLCKCTNIDITIA